MPICTLAGSKGSASAVSGVASPPRTSFCAPPRKTPTVPSAAPTVVTWAIFERSAIAVSRWSSRSFGAWPVPWTLAMRWLRSAIRVVSALIEVDRRAQVLGDAGLDRVDLVGGVAKARGEIADAGQHDLPRRGVLRLVRDVDEGVEHLLRGVAEARLAGRKHRLELLQLAAARRVGGGERGGRRRLAGQEVAVRARHRRDVDALAEEARAGLLAERRRQLDASGASSRRCSRWRRCCRSSAAPRSSRSSPASRC